VHYCYDLVTLPLTVLQVTTSDHLEAARGLFKEYASSLGVDLCFQDFERELKELPGEYSQPQGCILLAFHELTLVGCVAVRPLSSEICEIEDVRPTRVQKTWNRADTRGGRNHRSE